jgi:hypothetical protein
MLRLLLDPESLREGLDNWEEVALATLERTHREALAEVITTLGTPADVTAQAPRVETWFPADEASAEWCRAC